MTGFGEPRAQLFSRWVVSARSRQAFGSETLFDVPVPITNMKSSIDLIKEMVYNHCMDMFVALADPTRRTILELLASNGELSATAIYEQFPVSPQAVSQHLKVLREAHLVEMKKHAQMRLYRLNPRTLSQFEAWVQQMQQMYEDRFSSLDAVLESEKQKLVNDEQKSG